MERIDNAPYRSEKTDEGRNRTRGCEPVKPLFHAGQFAGRSNLQGTLNAFEAADVELSRVFTDHRLAFDFAVSGFKHAGQRAGSQAAAVRTNFREFLALTKNPQEISGFSTR